MRRRCSCRLWLIPIILFIIVALYLQFYKRSTVITKPSIATIYIPSVPSISIPSIQVRDDNTDVFNNHRDLQKSTDIWKIMNLSDENEWESAYKNLLEQQRTITSSVYKRSKQSLSANIRERTQFQQSQVERMCYQFYKQRLPPFQGTYGHHLLYSHLLYDDDKKVIYCYAPKTGCTNMKKSFLLMNGIYSEEQISEMNVTHEKHLYKVKSFSHLSRTEQDYRLSTYFKFVVMRNPLERLLSAYRNKLLRDDQHKYFKKLRVHIVKRYRRGDDGSGNHSLSHYPTFPEFIDFINSVPLYALDDHFQPVTDMCYPCTIKYNFYSNMKVLDYDADIIFHMLKIPPSYFSHTVEHPQSPTSQLLGKYYSQLSLWQKSQLFQKLQFEIHFYYALYPEEKNMHRRL